MRRPALSTESTGASSGVLSHSRAATLLATLALVITASLGVAAAIADAPPTLTIKPASEVAYTSAQLSGTVNPNSGPSTTSWHFEYSQTEEEGSWIQFDGGGAIEGAEAADSNPIPVQSKPEGLTPSTKYFFRLVAENGEGANRVVTDPPTPLSFTTKAVAKPSATIETPTAVTATTAHFAGQVNPNAPGAAPGQPAAFNTQWSLSCTPGCSFSTESSGGVEADDTQHEVQADATNLEPNVTYTVTLHASNAGGENDVVAQKTFKTKTSGADVSYLFPTSVNNVTSTSAHVVALVNVHNSALTDCHFEYGATAGYGQGAPCSSEPVGGRTVLVTGELSGLAPATTYHFRIVAANTVGLSAEGPDRTFKTFARPAPLSCSNESIRSAQQALALPACRAWEMVTPVDKNGGDIAGEGETTEVATNGNRVAFSSRASFADTEGSGALGQTQYLASREAGGWMTHTITPNPAAGSFQIFTGSTFIGYHSEDLGHVLIGAWDLPKVADDTPDVLNVYQEDTTTGETHGITVSHADPLGIFDWRNPFGKLGASSDYSTVAFMSRTRLLPEAPSGVPNVYEWEKGTLRLAGVLPDGAIPPEGSEIPGAYFHDPVLDSVSPDGKIVTFYASKEGNQQLYARRGHSNSAWISESEGSVPVPSAAGVRFEYITPDSRHILFTTTSKLLDADTNEGRDLYLYTEGPDPSSESNLTLISKNGRAEELTSVIGTNADASRIYFQTREEGIFLWENGQVRSVAPGVSGSEYSVDSVRPGAARVSADGKRLAFLTQASLPQDEAHGLTGEVTNHHLEMYLYDAPSETLTCVSCVPSSSVEEEGASSDVAIVPHATAGTATLSFVDRPRYLSADGKKVFFATGDALVPEDKNGAIDTYEYDAESGQVALVSSGRGELGTWFTDASASGGDVTMITRQKLVGADSDELTDIYDARTNGGFAEPPPPPTPCVGDGCHGPIPVPPGDVSPATPRFSGPGNPRPRNRGGHHHRHKSHKHKQHKRASAGRGGTK